MPVTPKDAAAIILLRDPDDLKIFWVKRNPRLTFMGGFHAFPGGQLDGSDAGVPVSNCGESDGGAMRACAVREFFEETGILVARGVEQLSTEQLRDLREQLEKEPTSFNDLLKKNDLTIDGADLIPAGRWVTPPFAPRRFDTWFFLAWLPEGQDPEVDERELESGEWIRPADALAAWKRGEIILAPPTLFAIRTLAANSAHPEKLAQALTSIPEAERGLVRRIEPFPGVFVFPVRTPTLPPATHTNCYVIGGTELIVIDPASPYEEEQKALDDFLDTLISEGRRVREILITHHHQDHIGGADHLSKRLNVPVAAHKLTAEKISDRVTVDRYIEDGEVIELSGDPGWRIEALLTPGHTRGHLCFYEQKTGALLSGDLIVGIGTVVIDPPDGNMLQYFDSLKRVRTLPKLSALFGAHGPSIGSAVNKIDEYLQHRTQRESKILDAVRQGAGTPGEIVQLAYTDVAPALYPLAERSIMAHLEKLEEEERVARRDGDRYIATDRAQP